jgi:hypothetical protein
MHIDPAGMNSPDVGLGLASGGGLDAAVMLLDLEIPQAEPGGP